MPYMLELRNKIREILKPLQPDLSMSMPALIERLRIAGYTTHEAQEQIVSMWVRGSLKIWNVRDRGPNLTSDTRVSLR